MNEPLDGTETSSRNSDDCLLELPLSRGQLPAAFGRYELTRVLGVGGMGTVYLARDTALQRLVALKIPNRVSDPDTLRRLLEEARIAARISHPNVCSIFDIASEDGQPFFTMEFVDGKSLEHFVSPDDPMSPLLAAKLVIRIAAGLHVAHQAGVLHRDLKPANILVRENMVPVITDFGLALCCEESGSKKVPRRLLGSPAYMSPEQVRCDMTEFGPTLDVYGLGAILYELIAGRRPFTGQIPEVYSQVLKRRPQPPSEFAPAVDERLDHICLRALAKSPVDRFQTVTEFSEALLQYLHAPRAITEDVVSLAAGEVNPSRISDRRASAIPVAPAVVLDAIPEATLPAPNRPLRPRLGQPNRTRMVIPKPNLSTFVTPRVTSSKHAAFRIPAVWLSGLITACVATLALTAWFGFWTGESAAKPTEVPGAMAAVITDALEPEQQGLDSGSSVQVSSESGFEESDLGGESPQNRPRETSDVREPIQTAAPAKNSNSIQAAALVAKRHLPSSLFASHVADGRLASEDSINVRFQLAQPVELSDAVVLLDGKQFDATRLDGAVSLPLGIHSISMESAQMETLSHSFEVCPAASSAPVLLPIVRRVGTLRLRIVRLFSNDKVKLDGQRVPLKRLAEPMTLPVGKHTLELVRERRPTKRKTFWVVAGQNADLNIAVQSRTPVDQSTAELLSLQESSDEVREMAEFPIRAGEIRAANLLGMQFGWCPGEPVDLSRPQTNDADDVGGFWIGRFEVTNAQWDLFSDADARIGFPLSQAENQRHVNSITWQQATDFADKLTRVERQRGRINAQWEFALPTQRQWAFAVSTGVKTFAEPAITAASAEGVPGGVNAWGVRTRGSKSREWCRDGNLQNGSTATDTKPHHLGFRLVLVRKALVDG